MQIPTTTTPISRCIDLAHYASRMLSKFPDNATLVESAARLLEGGQALDQASRAYEAARGQDLVLRVDIGYTDYQADRQVRRTQQLAEIEDGRRGGRIASRVFPTGSTPITRLRGDSQVAAMRDMEARLEGSRDIWPQAEAAQAALAEHRGSYEEVLAARAENQRNVKDLRAARDAAKERFLDLYAQIASLVRAEFPRDRVLQDLFFDRVRSRATSRKRAGNAEPTSPAPQAPAASGATA